MLMLFVGITPLAHADVNDFTIDSFEADYSLGTDDRQGSLTVREQLTVEFTDSNHGILRALPKQYNSMPQHLHILAVSRDGITEPYTTYSSNGNLVLKIGNADKTITGLHHYQLDYKVTNVMRFVNNKAELDWNVNGNDWRQPFQHVTARLHVPASLKGKLTDERCFTGVSGSPNSDCLVANTMDTTSYTTTRTLQPGETLTINGTLPTGYFSKPGLMDRWDDYGRQVITALILPILALMLAGSAWYRHGRDAKGRGTIVPEYGPPADLRPAEIDVLLHNKLGKNAVSATIIDLAIRKYLRLEESVDDGILGFGKHKNYSLIRLATPPAGALQGYEAQIFAGIFGDSDEPGLEEAVTKINTLLQSKSNVLSKIYQSAAKNILPKAEPTAVGEKVEMISLRNHFYKTLEKVQKSIPQSLTSRGFFTKNPASVGKLWLGLGLLIIFGSFYLIQFSLVMLISGISAGLILLIFGTLMPSRTPRGAAVKDAAEGLKLYLNTAEKDRIAMLQSPSAPYAPQTGEPVKTVELFEKLLPYAMVLGVEKQWAGQFQDIYTTPPEWYNGNWSTFNALYLADSLSDSMSAMNSSFAAPSSSGSGSGGSAGGGGGGGGGGGW